MYLPDDLHAVVKRRKLPVSELLQDAIRRGLELEEKRAAADKLVKDLIREHGEPSPRDMQWARALLRAEAKPKRRAD